MKENISEDFKDELHLIRNSFSDSLRNKFKDDKEKLKELDDINLYIEEIEKIYQKVS